MKYIADRRKRGRPKTIALCACSNYECAGELNLFKSQHGGEPKILCKVHHKECIEIDKMLLQPYIPKNWNKRVYGGKR